MNLVRLCGIGTLLAGLTLVGCGGGSANSDTIRALTPQQAKLVRRMPATHPPSHNHTLLQSHKWLLKELEECARITHTPLREAEEFGPPAYRECANVVIKAAHNAGW